MDPIRNRTAGELDPGVGWNSKEETRAQTARRVLSAATLAGDRVRNPAGDDLGKIEELMIDVPSGRVAYAVLSFGGFLGMGNKLFAIPWEALKLDEIEHEFILNVEKATLESAPGFDKDEWPDMADPDFGTQVYGHYGYKPFWNEERTATGSPTMGHESEKILRGGGV